MSRVTPTLNARAFGLALVLGALGLTPCAAQGGPELPAGYAVASRQSLDLDGKAGAETAYLVLPTSAQGTPRLWVYRGGAKALDWGFSRFDSIGTLAASGAPTQSILEARDLTGDGRPELLVRVVSHAKPSLAATYVFGWDGARFRNLIATEFALTPSSSPLRALVHSAQGGVMIQPAGRVTDLVVWEAEKGAAGRIAAQFFQWNGQEFALGRSMRSARPGKAGLQELGLLEGPTPRRPVRKEARGIFVTTVTAANRPICDRD